MCQENQEEKESWRDSIVGVLTGSPVGGALFGALIGLLIQCCGFLGEVPMTFVPTCAFMGAFIHMIFLALPAIRGKPREGS